MSWRRSSKERNRKRKTQSPSMAKHTERIIKKMKMTYHVYDGTDVFELTKEEISEKFGWTPRTTQAYIREGKGGNGILIVPAITTKDKTDTDSSYFRKFDREWNEMLKLFGKGKI